MVKWSPDETAHYLPTLHAIRPFLSTQGWAVFLCLFLLAKKRYSHLCAHAHALNINILYLIGN